MTPKAIGDLKQMRQHYNKFVIHFLPPMRDEAGANQGPWFVRFDRIRYVAKNSDEEKGLVGLRFASITSEFLPALVQRLSTFSVGSVHPIYRRICLHDFCDENGIAEMAALDSMWIPLHLCGLKLS